MKNKPGLGVVVGKFQVHELHAGHKYLLDHAARHQRMLILVGTPAGVLSRDYPLDYHTREMMLTEAYPNASVQPLLDQPTDSQWSEGLDHVIRTIHRIGDVTLYGGRDSFIPHYNGLFKTEEVETIHQDNGSAIRDDIAFEPLAHPLFRRGMIYASRNVFPRVNCTVDIAVTRPIDTMLIHKAHIDKDAEYMVLLGQKKIQPGLWRFPGGFVDGNDDSYEMAAKRECHEETGLVSESKPIYIESMRIQDWRDTTDAKTHTVFFHVPHTIGKAKGDDDLPLVDWFPVNRREFDRISWADEHKVLAEALLTYMEERYEAPTPV